MDDAAIIAIGVVALMVAAAGIWTYMRGPNSPMSSGWRRRLNELEVTSRMGSPEEIIAALQESAKLHVRLGKRSEAEVLLRRAMLIATQNYGHSYPGLAPIMDDYALVMESMHRKKEAQKMRADAQKLREKHTGQNG